MSRLDRREFLNSVVQQGAGIAAANLAAGVFAADTEKPKISPADRPPVRVAVMGVRNRGKDLVDDFSSFPNVEIAYICDVDQNVIAPSVKILEKKGKPAPQIVSDFRKALDDKSVTVLACAAPDHWHALASIWACQAGKDVYVEKPCSHTPREGRRMVEVARKTKRIVQVGTQRRTSESIQKLVEYVRSGKLGKVGFARAWITGPRPNIGHESVQPAPSQLDFDLWCGPAPNNGYKKNLVPYHWHWRWDYGTGECGNNGVHGLDVLRWALGVEYPTRVTSGGGKYIFDDDQETPDTQLATFEYKGGAFAWEHRTWSQRGLDGQKSGLAFYGTKANLLSDERNWTVYGLGKKEEVIHTQAHTPHELPHVENFLNALVTRELPSADIEINHRTTLMCQLANIAWRTRSTVNFDGDHEQVLNNPAAEALMAREQYRKGFELPSA